MALFSATQPGGTVSGKSRRRCGLSGETDRVFEANVPSDNPDPSNTFFCTFPYPYMNGRLHLGHAFTVTKADFAAAYQKLKGKTSFSPSLFTAPECPSRLRQTSSRWSWKNMAARQFLMKDRRRRNLQRLLPKQRRKLGRKKRRGEAR